MQLNRSTIRNISLIWVESKNALINKSTLIAFTEHICVLTLNLVSTEISLAKTQIQKSLLISGLQMI